MSRLFTEAGEHVPVTLLKVDGCRVVSHRTKDRDGYTALQLGVGKAKVKNVSKGMRGHFAKSKVEPARKLAEFRVSEDAMIDVGAELTADHFVWRCPGAKSIWRNTYRRLPALMPSCWIPARQCTRGPGVPFAWEQVAPLAATIRDALPRSSPGAWMWRCCPGDGVARSLGRTCGFRRRARAGTEGPGEAAELCGRGAAGKIAARL